MPLVATIHATEAGRHGGWLSAPLNRQVHSVEWWLANAADALVTCSQAMRDEVAGLFDVDPDAITVLHNGIDPAGWSVPSLPCLHLHGSNGTFLASDARTAPLARRPADPGHVRAAASGRRASRT